MAENKWYSCLRLPTNTAQQICSAFGDEGLAEAPAEPPPCRSPGAIPSPDSVFNHVPLPLLRVIQRLEPSQNTEAAAKQFAVSVAFSV